MFELEGLSAKDLGRDEKQTYEEWSKDRDMFKPEKQEVKEPEPTDGFVRAETIEEAEQWAHDNYGLFNNTSTLNLETLNDLNSRMYELSKTFDIPPIKKIYDVGGNLYGQAMSVTKEYTEIGFNPTYLNNRERYAKSIANDIQAVWHPIGTESPLAIIDHEIAHIMTAVDLRAGKAVMGITLDPDVAFKHEIQKLKTAYTKHIDNSNIQGTVISRYASKNLDEFVAESFSMVTSTKNPNTYAQKVYDLMVERYGKK
jgi:hypothetical protein